jgi:hypothetical protein
VGSVRLNEKTISHYAKTEELALKTVELTLKVQEAENEYHEAFCAIPVNEFVGSMMELHLGSNEVCVVLANRSHRTTVIAPTLVADGFLLHPVGGAFGANCDGKSAKREIKLEALAVEPGGLYHTTVHIHTLERLPKSASVILDAGASVNRRHFRYSFDRAKSTYVLQL